MCLSLLEPGHGHPQQPPHTLSGARRCGHLAVQGPPGSPPSVAKPRLAPAEHGPLLRSTPTSFPGASRVPPCVLVVCVVASAEGTGCVPLRPPRALHSEVSRWTDLAGGKFVICPEMRGCFARPCPLSPSRAGPVWLPRGAGPGSARTPHPTALRRAHPPRAGSTLLKLHSEPGVTLLRRPGDGEPGTQGPDRAGPTPGVASPRL